MSTSFQSRSFTMPLTVLTSGEARKVVCDLSESVGHGFTFGRHEVRSAAAICVGSVRGVLRCDLHRR